MTPTDRLLAGYVGFVTMVILIRGPFSHPAYPWMLVAHGLFALLLWLFTRLDDGQRIGTFVHDLYPIVLLLPFYTQIGLLNPPIGSPEVMANDTVIQRLESIVFGGQISYTWLRASPSVFWSGLLHAAYFAYYPIVVLGPTWVWLRGDRSGARSVLFATMAAFVVCYLWFILFPVAGPYYAFDRPVGPVRDVWSARLVYGVLSGGSSFGAAFPSSHVAATVATTLALWRVRRPMGAWLTAPCVLLTVGTVYCQMHYGIDASSGILVGVAGYAAAQKLRFT